MKKVISLLLALVLVFALTACGVIEIEKRGSIADSDFKEKEKMSDRENPSASFSSGVLTTKDFKIEITDYKVLKTERDHDEDPVIAFWYSTTNLGEDGSLTPSKAWGRSFSAFQKINDTQTKILDLDDNIDDFDDDDDDDDRIFAQGTETISKGNTVSSVIYYELENLSSPVILNAKDHLSGSIAGEQTFEIYQ